MYYCTCMVHVYSVLLLIVTSLLKASHDDIEPKLKIIIPNHSRKRKAPMPLEPVLHMTPVLLADHPIPARLASSHIWAKTLKPIYPKLWKPNDRYPSAVVILPNLQNDQKCSKLPKMAKMVIFDHFLQKLHFSLFILPLFNNIWAQVLKKVNFTVFARKTVKNVSRDPKNGVFGPK